MHPPVPWRETGLSLSLLQPPPQWKPFFCHRCESPIISLPQSTFLTDKEVWWQLPPYGRLHGTAEHLSVNLTSSLLDGGPVQVSVCAFSSLCQYYSVKEGRWTSEGLKPLEGSTLHTARCLTQHLTMFGASLFVHPGAVILLPPVCENTEHTSNPSNPQSLGRGNSSTASFSFPYLHVLSLQSDGPVGNIVAGIVCAALVLIHLLVGLIAHKLDHLDSLRLSQVPLCGRPGLYQYRVLVKTGWRRGAGQREGQATDIEEILSEYKNISHTCTVVFL